MTTVAPRHTLAGFVYRRSSLDVRLWAAGPWVLHVYSLGKRRWYAELHDLRSPRGTWPDEVVCRSRSRAVDVGRRMLARALRGAPHVER